MKNKEKRGISLVALIITIIVLIILTGAVIMNITGENNTIDKAKEAVFKNDITTYRDSLAIYEMNKKLNAATEQVAVEETNATTAGEIKEIIPEFKSEYEGIVKISNGKLVGGDNIRSKETEWLSQLNVDGVNTKVKFYIGDNSTMLSKTEYEVDEGTTLREFANQQGYSICSQNYIHYTTNNSKMLFDTLREFANIYEVIEVDNEYFWANELCNCQRP